LSGVLADNDGFSDWSRFCYCSYVSEVRHPPWNQFVVMLKCVRNALWGSMIGKVFWWNARRKKNRCSIFQLMLPEKPLIRGNVHCLTKFMFKMYFSEDSNTVFWFILGSSIFTFYWRLKAGHLLCITRYMLVFFCLICVKEIRWNKFLYVF